MAPNMAQPQGAPMTHKFLIGTIAVLLGGYLTYKAGSDFQFIKYEPHSPEEVERRQREKIPLKMTVLDTTSLDLTPEAKERIWKKQQKMIQEKQELEKREK